MRKSATIVRTAGLREIKYAYDTYVGLRFKRVKYAYDTRTFCSEVKAIVYMLLTGWLQDRWQLLTISQRINNLMQ